MPHSWRPRLQYFVKNIAFLSIVTLSSIKSTSASQKEYHFVQHTSHLDYDENDKLAYHTIVSPREECIERIIHSMPETNFQLVVVEEDASLDFFPSYEHNNNSSSHPNDHVEEDEEGNIKSRMECPMMCLERGVDYSLVTYPTENRIYDGKGSVNVFNWLKEECAKVEVCFINYYNKDTPIRLNWVNKNGDLVNNGDIPYGEKHTRCITSFIGHTFKLVDNESGQTIDTITVEHVSTIPIGEDPPHDTIKDNHDLISRVQNTLHGEWNKHTRVQRTFTPLGFKKGRLPPDLFGSMGAFYYNNHHRRVREEWGGKGIFVNWWETDVTFIGIPANVKDRWADRLRLLVEEWVGEELEQTSMYGIRQYTQGARLLTHVDRETTHATSLIVNIAQGNVEEAWPVDIYDHAGRLHQIVMEPGDIVYYESAACLHGRNTPLKGEGAYYANIFTHYRPTGDPDWLFRENPEGSPERLMDVGECRLREGMEGRVGVGAVTCDDPAVGPYLSPDLLTAHSGDDLFQWWLKVGPQKIRDYMARKEQKEDVVPQEKADESNENQEDEDDDENEDDDDETSIENENEADAEEL